MTDNLPNEDDVGKALKYLAETDKEYALAITRVKAMEYKIKTIKAVAYLEAKGTGLDKKAISESSVEYIQFTKDYESTVYDKELVSARRKRAELTIEVWRSLNANRRQGNIT